ncbi:MAG: dUTP diphosphatase [Hydrogenophilus sp.]|nr:dUTP diphosphatase [Hydrogenophilus sp.]
MKEEIAETQKTAGRRKVAVRFLDPRIAAHPPCRASAGAAAFDLRAAIAAPLTLAPGDTVLIPTGVAIYLADPSLAALILPRSGLGHHQGLVLGNLVGLIDSDYQGEIQVSLWNRGQAPVVIEPLMRVAQLLVISVLPIEMVPVEAFTPTARSTKGFGSTGTE